MGLLKAAGLWDAEQESLGAEEANQADLLLVHDRDYVNAVIQGGIPSVSSHYGFASVDNPPFPRMHYAASLMSGGAVKAARTVMDGSVTHAFHPAGGWHHALPARASGFCIYNDPAVAAAVLARDYGASVLYIDLDCHHGDGVQWMFYDRADIYTVSLHESGRFLFPGTGDVTEIGEGAGRGFCLNVPFLPFTTDGDWRDALDVIIPTLAEQFRPDIILSNHGCDTHVWDPITHLALTTDSLRYQASLMHGLAHELCDGRWLAVGSGGYEWRRVVPRSWAILWAEMSGRSLPNALPTEWAKEWLTDAEKPHPSTFLDPPEMVGITPGAEESSRGNRATIGQAAERLVVLER